MPRVAVAPLRRVTRDGSRTDQDLVAVEAPLVIELVTHTAIVISLGVFMRTPGDDEALALGALHAEGVIQDADDVTDMALTMDADGVSALLRVTLAATVTVDAAALARSTLATTACGLCGRLNATVGNVARVSAQRTDISPDVFFQLPAKLREAQAVFEKTGGLHAAAFFDTSGACIDLAEDVGRHNAVDKVVGRALLQLREQRSVSIQLREQRSVSVPLREERSAPIMSQHQRRAPGDGRVLMVSGRAAYEIVQKAAMARVAALAAVGAPSSLAVQAAREARLTLIGFLKDGSYNVYA